MSRSGDAGRRGWQARRDVRDNVRGRGYGDFLGSTPRKTNLPEIFERNISKFTEEN
jgi:hypothetical protein